MTQKHTPQTAPTFGLIRAFSKHLPQRAGLLSLLTLLLLIVTAPSHAYPYFGPIPAFEQYVAQGFFYGWQFFKEIGNPSGALYYLTLTGALVGFLLIIFNKKMQGWITMGAWFVCTVVLLLLPVNSQLLFTDLKDTINVEIFNFKEDSSFNPEEVSEDNDTRGFAPQVLAIHTVSVVHNALASFFQAEMGHDFISQYTAVQNLFTGENGVCIDSAKYKDVQKFISESGCSPNDINLAEDHPDPDNSQSITLNFGEFAREVHSAVTEPDEVSTLASAPPKVALLPTSVADVPADWDKEKYINGLVNLASTITGQTKVELESLAVADVTFVSDPVAYWTNLLFSDDLIGTSEVSTWAGYSNPNNLSTFIAPAIKTADGFSLDTEHPAYFHRYFLGAPSGGLYPTVWWPKTVNETSAGLMYQAAAVDPDLEVREAGVNRTEMLRDMPVIPYHVKPCDANRKNMGDIRTCDLTPDTASTVSSADGTKCSNVGNIIAQDLLTDLKTYGDLTEEFTTQLLQTPSTLPKGNFTDAEIAAFYDIYKIYPNNPKGTSLLDGYFKGYAHKEDGAKKFRQDILRGAVACAETKQNEKETGTEDKVEKTVVSTPGLGTYDSVTAGAANSWFAQTIQRAIGGTIVSIVAGTLTFVANIIIDFTIVMVGLGLMAILVLTPFLMLMGVVMPSYAPGLLTTSVITVAVLKFVPLTLTLINYLATVLYYVTDTLIQGL